MTKGKFIVFEGIDGSGKSTVAQKLQDALQARGQSVYRTFEPTDNPIGSLLRKILTKKMKADEKTIAALFLADRLHHLQNEEDGILKQLAQGTTVICDRYYFSSYAYHCPYVSLDWVINANSICAQLLRPDIVFFIDISVQESLRRITQNRTETELFETAERLTTVRNNYYTAINRLSGVENVRIIQGEQSPKAVFEAVWQQLSD